MGKLAAYPVAFVSKQRDGVILLGRHTFDFQIIAHKFYVVGHDFPTETLFSSSFFSIIFRAVYRDADIYLLDDPLSAVDTLVGRHIFER